MTLPPDEPAAVPGLLPRREFVWRALGFAAFGLGGIGLALLAGMLGYHGLGGLAWIDAFLNAAMILSGMGPLDPMPTDTAKMFSGLYAIIGSLVWAALVGIILYPFIHRGLHALHLQATSGGDDD